jgi:hypothetical protein
MLQCSADDQNGKQNRNNKKDADAAHHHQKGKILQHATTQQGTMRCGDCEDAINGMVMD